MRSYGNRLGERLMRVLLIGGGGREHAIAWKLRQSPRLRDLWCAPGNAGTAALGQNVALETENPAAIVAFCRQQSVDLVVIGPEDPLCAGLADALLAAGVRTFGPTRAAARLEGDKAFAKEMMRHRSIPTAEARVFTKYRDAYTYVASRDAAVVIKAAGLAKGKGVVVCDDP